VTMADLQDAIHSGDRPRYEMVGTRVRALYGHSIDVEPGEPSRPPEVLHVGISARDADRAMRYGLRGGRRRFLHLALTPDDAKEGGRRTGRDYVVITVYALDAWEEGINFYDRKALFLAEQIPIEFLEISETCHDGVEPETRGPGGRREHSGDRHRGGHQRAPMGEREMAAPRQEPRSAESFEEEGFGDAGQDGLQVQRERGPQPAGAPGGAPRGEARGDFRGDRPQRGGSRHGGDRGRRDESRPMQNSPSRPPQAGPRSWEGEPAGAPNAREESDQRSFANDRPAERPRYENAGAQPSSEFQGERAPRDSRREPAPERRDFDRPARGERPPEGGERQPDRGGRGPDRGERPAERPQRPFDRGDQGGQGGQGGQGDQGDQGGQGGRGDSRGGRGEPRGFDRGERPDRNAPDRNAPARQAPPPSAPERAREPRPAQAAGEPSPGFGLGIYEEPAAQRRPAPPPPRQAAPPPPPPPPAPREKEPEDGGFGAGI